MKIVVVISTEATTALMNGRKRRDIRIRERFPVEREVLAMIDPIVGHVKKGLVVTKRRYELSETNKRIDIK